MFQCSLKYFHEEVVPFIINIYTSCELSLLRERRCFVQEMIESP